VLMRGFFNAPTEWSIEISVYLIMASGFLGLAPALAGNNHISVDLITSKLSPKRNKVLHTFTSVIGLIFCLILTISSADMVLVSYEINSLSTSTLRIPLFIPQAAIPVGSALIVLEFLRQLLGDLVARPAKEGK
jgi:C4-dicarboxylate transporter, DctQ subunit